MMYPSSAGKRTGLDRVRSLFRYDDGMVPNLAALGYAFCGLALGVFLMTRREGWLNFAGVILAAHALSVSAYVIHECAHGAIFATAAHNDRLGKVMAWLNGACLAPYDGLKEKHLRHHADRMDVVTFDYRAVLNAAPVWCRTSVLALEWAYIPAVELLMRGLVVATPFIEGDRRAQGRILRTGAARLGLFALLGLWSLKALLLYVLAYLIFLHILRFQDAFQHTFEVYVTRSLTPLDPALRRDRVYEQANTYSDVVSVQIPRLNALFLNFSYHNAHHARPGAPWYRLARLHEELFAEDRSQILPWRTLLRTYHKNRVARVLAMDYGTVSAEGARAGNFLGAVGVSFLTAV